MSEADASRLILSGGGGGSSVGGDGEEPDAALSAWLSARLARELKRLASAGQRSMELRVASTGVLRRPLGAGGALVRVHRLRVISSFDFSSVSTVLTSPPAPCDVKPGYHHVFVVLIVQPAAPALIAHYVYAPDADDASEDLRFFSILNSNGHEALLEVRDAATVVE